ncbi:AAA family ATPase [Tuanshanicoccus lijuaniae]|uniref:Rep family protein n=1 Tax=Aerococcaceae bacterium zg-1292 TaxID=2774330 RepID=UPI00193544B4|nr:AAA family ATPase [Aerococcaceae bacterium zg-1292]QQA36544.1 AAA family ATPase [Aerococcaceae bacterium zg-1292]
MAKKEANLTTIVIVQQLKEEYWLSSDYVEAIQQAKKGNCRTLLEIIVKKLEENNIIVSEAYIIKHDKDKVSVWNSEKLTIIVEDKAEHVHVLLKFEKGASLNKIAVAIEVETQYLEKLKSGRYGYDNCLAYLVHAKDETKHQYQPEEVTTLRGEDYTSIYHRSMENWVKGRATKKAKETSYSIDWLVEQILAGQITKTNILLTDEFYSIYGQHKRKINEALDSAGERKSYQTIAELEAGKFKKTTFFINARSGAGKTQYGKKLIRLLQEIALKFGQKWDFCVTASTNAFDEYNGQDILFLDDMKGESLMVSDWLKLLDPYMISPISARYHNKMGSAKVIIITNTQEPVDFFEHAKGIFREDIGQFVRRIDYLIEINDKFHLSIPRKNMWDQNTKISSYDRDSYTFKFFEINQCNINEATDILVKTVIRNMKWNKSKKVIDASDQTNNDNPTFKQQK